MLWALFIMGNKAQQTLNERRIFKQSLINLSAGSRVRPQDTTELMRRIQNLPATQQKLILPNHSPALCSALLPQRMSQQQQQRLKTAVKTESDRLDSELSMIRYIAWQYHPLALLGLCVVLAKLLVNTQSGRR